MDVAVAIGLSGRALTRALYATGRGVVLVATAALSLTLFITTTLATAFILLGVGVLLLPLVTPLVRRLTGLCRNLAARSGVPIATPYLPLPPLEPGVFGWVQRCGQSSPTRQPGVTCCSCYSTHWSGSRSGCCRSPCWSTRWRGWCSPPGSGC